MKETKIRRGDIFSYDFGTRIGSIQSGVRPVLVIQADNFNTKKNRLKRIRAMALKLKPDIRRSTRSMSFGRS